MPSRKTLKIFILKHYPRYHNVDFVSTVYDPSSRFVDISHFSLDDTIQFTREINIPTGSNNKACWIWWVATHFYNKLYFFTPRLHSTNNRLISVMSNGQMFGRSHRYHETGITTTNSVLVCSAEQHTLIRLRLEDTHLNAFLTQFITPHEYYTLRAQQNFYSDAYTDFCKDREDYRSWIIENGSQRNSEP